MQNDARSQKEHQQLLESRLLNLSLKDIQAIFRENRELRESLKQLKSREILLVGEIQKLKQTRPQKENRPADPKKNHWGAPVDDIDRLQQEINGSVLELEKSERRARESEGQAAHERKALRKLRQEIDILRTQKNFLDSQLEYSEKKAHKKDTMLKGLRNQLTSAKDRLTRVEDERDRLLMDRAASLSQVSRDIHETGAQSLKVELGVDKKQALDLESRVSARNLRRSSGESWSANWASRPTKKFWPKSSR